MQQANLHNYFGCDCLEINLMTEEMAEKPSLRCPSGTLQIIMQMLWDGVLCDVLIFNYMIIVFFQLNNFMVYLEFYEGS